MHTQKHINYLSQMIFFSSKAPTQNHKAYIACDFCLYQCRHWPQCDCGGCNMALDTHSHLNTGPHIHLSSLNAFSNGDYKDSSSPHFLLFSIRFGKVTNSLLHFPPLPFMLFLASFLSFPFSHLFFFLVPSGLYFLHFFRSLQGYPTVTV